MAFKIGLGIITCNREHFLRQCIDSIHMDMIDEICVINDGDRLSLDITDTYRRIFMIEHVKNLGVGKSKNDAFKYLLSHDCDYIFILEDDVQILDKSIFNQYIEAHRASGIHHFNYGPGSPFNRKQTIQNFDIHNRHLLEGQTEPEPKMVVDYGNDVKVSLFTHAVGMFSFFTKEVLDKVGLIDEEYYNAWEHVDHTYRIIKEGYHPPFWYFADIYNSHKYITEAKKSIDESSIAKDNKQWQENVYKQREVYKKKHGHYPNEPPAVTKEQVTEILKTIKNER